MAEQPSNITIESLLVTRVGKIQVPETEAVNRKLYRVVRDSYPLLDSAPFPINLLLRPLVYAFHRKFIDPYIQGIKAAYNLATLKAKIPNAVGLLWAFSPNINLVIKGLNKDSIEITEDKVSDTFLEYIKS